MSEWPNRGMLWLPETIDQGVDTAWGCNCHCLCLWFLSVACVCSGLLLIARASGLGLGVGRFSGPLRVLGVLALLDPGLDTAWRVQSVSEVPPGAGVPWLLEPSVVVGVYIDHRCVADGVEVTRWVISATPESFSKDKEVEFWRWIVETTELHPWEWTLSPAGAEKRLIAGVNSEFPGGLCCICVWRICWTGVVSGFELATSPGHPLAARIVAGSYVRFGSWPGRKPDSLCLGGFVTWTRHKHMGFRPGWNRAAVPTLKFLHLGIRLSIWVVIVL